MPRSDFELNMGVGRQASLLASYENAEAISDAKDLDAKVEGLLASAAA